MDLLDRPTDAPQQRHPRRRRVLIAAAAGAVILAGGIALGVGLTRDAPAAGPTPSPTWPDTFGDSALLDGLWTDCADGDHSACRVLEIESPEGSHYNQFGASCGRTDPEAVAEPCD
jgi:hypothetical protein